MFKQLENLCTNGLLYRSVVLSTPSLDSSIDRFFNCFHSFGTITAKVGARRVKPERNLKVSPYTSINSINTPVAMIENAIKRIRLGRINRKGLVATSLVTRCPTTSVTNGNQVVIIQT